MLDRVIGAVRQLYRTYILGHSLTRQGLCPWWQERSGSSPARQGYWQNSIGRKR